MPINANDEILGGRPEVKPMPTLPLVLPEDPKHVKPGNLRQELPATPSAMASSMTRTTDAPSAGGNA